MPMGMMVESIVPGWFERSETVVTAEQTSQILQWTKVTVQFNIWQTVLKWKDVVHDNALKSWTGFSHCTIRCNVLYYYCTVCCHWTIHLKLSELALKGGRNLEEEEEVPYCWKPNWEIGGNFWKLDQDGIPTEQLRFFWKSDQDGIQTEKLRIFWKPDSNLTELNLSEEKSVPTEKFWPCMLKNCYVWSDQLLQIVKIWPRWYWK